MRRPLRVAAIVAALTVSVAGLSVVHAGGLGGLAISGSLSGAGSGPVSGCELTGVEVVPTRSQSTTTHPGVVVSGVDGACVGATMTVVARSTGGAVVSVASGVVSGSVVTLTLPAPIAEGSAATWEVTLDAP